MRGAVRSLWLVAFLVAAGPLAAQEEGEAAGSSEPVVRAVLFYSPTCPHCREVIENHLPPLRERYGEGLRIAFINTTTVAGAELYRVTVAELAVPSGRLGVPTLVVGSNMLVGSLEIPRDLPAIIESGLVSGGIDWPSVPVLREAIASAGGEAVQLGPVDHQGGGLVVPKASFEDRFMRDPAGNLVSVVLLFLMVAALVLVARTMVGTSFAFPVAPSWAVPLLASVGLGIAVYLSLVEMTGAEAVCGPVGDCNAVQQSRHARLFGLVPVGLLGAAGYGAILAAWGFGAVGPEERREAVRRAVWWMALAATLFSLYLTFLEPFVIGATCAWCLGSAAASTLILLVATSDLRPPPKVLIGRAARRRSARGSPAS